MMNQTSALVQQLSRIVEEVNEIGKDAQRALANVERYESRFRGFRFGSGAYRVASMLLASEGCWLSKNELAHAAKVSYSVVPTVVGRLEGNGVVVSRRTRVGKAEYRVEP